jgi:hypothetical protein
LQIKANGMSEPQRLDSWKEIARYLRRDVTTAIRWGRERGLPVHRVPGGKLSRVFAYTNELDEWLRRSPDETPEALRQADVIGDAPAAAAVSPARTKRYWVLGAAGMAATLGVAVVAALVRSTDPVAGLEISGNALIARGESGAVLWSHAFDAASVAKGADHWIYQGDVDADGEVDHLAAIAERTGPGRAAVDRLHRFSNGGRLLWSCTPDDRLRFAAGEYGPPWATSTVQVYRAGNKPRIAWAVHHFTWWPSLLLSLDPAGNRLSAFVNAGWITGVAGTHDGRHLATVGMSNAHRSYFFAVLDAEKPEGRSPEPDGAATQCLSCPEGRPLHYYVFPRTHISEQFPYPADPPGVTVFPDGSVLAHVIETPGPAIGTTLYEFGPDFALRKIRVSDSFDEWHRRLESQGRVRHGVDECPDRMSREIRRWAPGSGWTTERRAVGG